MMKKEQNTKSVFLVDCHSHLDLCSNPLHVVNESEKAGVYTVSVTNVPSAFISGYAHFTHLKHTRLALGFHPLLAGSHIHEKKLFEEYSSKTSFIGEIGLDFSTTTKVPKATQLDCFRFVLNCIKDQNKFISIHSRNAAETVLNELSKIGRKGVILHWFTGSIDLIDVCLNENHYFSINSQMISNTKGQKLLELVPLNRILTETDCPFTKINNRPTQPSDVIHTIELISKTLNKPVESIKNTIFNNFIEIMNNLK